MHILQTLILPRTDCLVTVELSEFTADALCSCCTAYFCPVTIILMTVNCAQCNYSILACSNTGSPQICNTSKLLLYHYYSTPVATLWRALRLVSLQLCARLLLPNLLSHLTFSNLDFLPWQSKWFLMYTHAFLKCSCQAT